MVVDYLSCEIVNRCQAIDPLRYLEAILTGGCLFHRPVEYRNPLLEHVHLNLDLITNELGSPELTLQFNFQFSSLSFLLLSFQELSAVFDDGKISSGSVDTYLSFLYFEQLGDLIYILCDHLVIQF